MTAGQAFRRLPAGLRALSEWWRPLGVAVVMCLAVLVLGPSSAMDRELSDRLLRREAAAADPALLIVEIDAADARHFGGNPITRPGLTELLDSLAALGAERVLLDIYLGEPLFPDADARLAAAMARLGPARLGLVSAATPDERPYDLFARHGTLIDARLTPDQDGFNRRIGRPGEASGANPSAWLATGRSDPAPVLLDLRVATRGFERVSARAAIADRSSLAGRKVVISASSSIAPSRAFLPLSRSADRAAVIALGAQSDASGYPALHRRGEAANTVLLVLGLALGFFVAFIARSGRMLALSAGFGAVLLVSASTLVALHWGAEVYPLRLLGCFAVMVNVTLAQRLRIVPMMGSFLRGDITPEEVWAWRSYEQSAHPALLIGADGRIKRSNPAATPLIERHGEALVRLCLPRLGERADELELEEGDFHLDWPYTHVPIVVLRDAGAALAAQRGLQEQLLRDELTGQANRRGFDSALHSAAQAGGAYGVFFLDMNGFKAVNDTHGHDAGDELLVVVAARLAALLREDDCVARLGGDEFGIVIPGMAVEAEAADLRRRLAVAVAEPVSLSCTGGAVTVGVAVGYALTPGGGEDPGELLRIADQAMYRDKHRARLRAAA